jgi:protease I
MPKMSLFAGFGVVSLCVVVLLIAYSNHLSSGGKSMNKKVLFILMPEGYQDLEFNVPYQTLQSKGCVVDVAGLQQGVAKGKLGGSFTPNLLLANLSTSDFDKYDAVVIPGGPGSVQYLWGNKKVQNVVEYFNSKGKVVATICYAVIVPVQAGILKGKKATVFPTDEAKAILKDCGVEFVDNGYVTLTADKIITAQGPKFANEFANEIVKMLS